MENATATVLSAEDLHEVYHGFKHQVWVLSANFILSWRRFRSACKSFICQVLY